METLETVIARSLKKYIGRDIPSLEMRAIENSIHNRGMIGALTAIENISSKYFAFNHSTFKRVSGSKMLNPTPSSIKQSLKIGRTIIIHNEDNIQQSFQLVIKGTHFYAWNKKVESFILKQYIKHKNWNIYEISLK